MKKLTLEKFQEEIKKEQIYKDSNLAIQKNDAVHFIEIRTTPETSYMFLANRITHSVFIYKYERGYKIS